MCFARNKVLKTSQACATPTEHIRWGTLENLVEDMVGTLVGGLSHNTGLFKQIWIRHRKTPTKARHEDHNHNENKCYRAQVRSCQSSAIMRSEGACWQGLWTQCELLRRYFLDIHENTHDSRQSRLTIFDVSTRDLSRVAKANADELSLHLSDRDLEETEHITILLKATRRQNTQAILHKWATMCAWSKHCHNIPETFTSTWRRKQGHHELTNREELSLRTVLALPKASKTGLAWITCWSKVKFPWRRRKALSSETVCNAWSQSHPRKWCTCMMNACTCRPSTRKKNTEVIRP